MIFHPFKYYFYGLLPIVKPDPKLYDIVLIYKVIEIFSNFS